MSVGTSPVTFELPEGWTLRQVASALAREWLAPLRAEPAAKAARWVVQSVVEPPSGTEAPLWEAGISTAEYEERLERADLAWVIRASAGRGKQTVLARLALSKEHAKAFELERTAAPIPDALLDQEKLQEFLAAQGAPDSQNVFATLISSQGFRQVEA